MYAEQKGSGYTIHLEDEEYTSYFDALVDVYNCIPDSIEFINEGAECCLGNDYAQHEFTAFVEGLVYSFAFGPNEYYELRDKGMVELAPFGWNELADMPDWIRPEWAE